MRCYGVRLPSALKHEKLGQNSHGLEPYRERPKNLERSDEVWQMSCEGVYLWDAIVVREKESQQSTEPEEILHFKGISVGVMRWLIVVEHEVDDISWRADEQDFKSRIIERVRESPE
jgi:hypothetical protein